MRIAIDAMGGDHAPKEAVLGAMEAVKQYPDIEILLVGDESKIKEHGNFKKHPEVGMVGLKLARDNEPIIDQEARFIEENGFEINEDFGRHLIEYAENSIIHDIKSLLQ